jgi:hypothetical protein
MPPTCNAAVGTCMAALRCTNADHGTRCIALATQTTLCHDILTGIWHCAVHRVGIASTLEPALCHLPGGPGTSTDGFLSRLGIRGDIFLATTQVIVIATVSPSTPCQSCRCPTGPPESDRIFRSRAKRLHPGNHLRGVVQMYQTAGDEAPASARTRPLA